MLLSRDADGKPSPLNTILFCRSMREVRAIGRLVDQRLEQRAPHLKHKVKSYISANLTIDVKREIYNGLRSGALLGVISTNALEAGIDIGSLDACIIAGFPFSVMALRQMAGRVGRKEEGVVLLHPLPAQLAGPVLQRPPRPAARPSRRRSSWSIRRTPTSPASTSTRPPSPPGSSESDLRRYWGERAGGDRPPGAAGWGHAPDGRSLDGHPTRLPREPKMCTRSATSAPTCRCPT